MCVKIWNSHKIALTEYYFYTYFHTREKKYIYVIYSIFTENGKITVWEIAKLPNSSLSGAVFVLYTTAFFCLFCFCKIDTFGFIVAVQLHVYRDVQLFFLNHLPLILHTKQSAIFPNILYSLLLHSCFKLDFILSLGYFFCLCDCLLRITVKQILV